MAAVAAATAPVVEGVIAALEIRAIIAIINDGSSSESRRNRCMSEGDMMVR